MFRNQCVESIVNYLVHAKNSWIYQRFSITAKEFKNRKQIWCNKFQYFTFFISKHENVEFINTSSKLLKAYKTFSLVRDILRIFLTTRPLCNRLKILARESKILFRFKTWNVVRRSIFHERTKLILLTL